MHTTLSPSGQERDLPSSVAEPLVRVDALRVHYPVGRAGFWGQKKLFLHAVDDVSIELRRGEVLGLVGESGSGKTTLGRTILGLVSATEGSVQFEGREITKLSERQLRALRREMQIVFQDPHASLNPAMTVAQLVEHPLQIHKIGSAAERKSRQFSLQAYYDTLLAELRRVGVVAEATR